MSQLASAADWPFDVLLHQGAEDVRHGLVQRAGLVAVRQAGGELGDAVRQFVADDAQGLGEPLEDLAVAVAEDHLVAVPEGIVVQLAEMDGGVQAEPAAVNGVPAKDVRVEAVGWPRPS